MFNNMVHCSCGSLNHLSACMQDGKCFKKYPKNFVAETQLGTAGYPLYKRRSPDCGGQTGTVRMRSQGGYVTHTTDNNWIVPCHMINFCYDP